MKWIKTKDSHPLFYKSYLGFWKGDDNSEDMVEVFYCTKGSAGLIYYCRNSSLGGRTEPLEWAVIDLPEDYDFSYSDEDIVTFEDVHGLDTNLDIASRNLELSEMIGWHCPEREEWKSVIEKNKYDRFDMLDLD